MIDHESGKMESTEKAAGQESVIRGNRLDLKFCSFPKRDIAKNALMVNTAKSE